MSYMSYVSLLIIGIIAFAIPLVVNKIKRVSIPIVVGEIIAGIIIGKSGFDLIQGSEWLSFLYNLGFAFLMFMAGIEIDFNLIISLAKTQKVKWHQHPLIMSLILFSTTLVLSLLVAFGLKWIGLIPDVVIFTIILSSTSVGIVVPILKEREMLSSKYGQIILLSSLFSDFFTMILLSSYITFIATNSLIKLCYILLFIPIFVLIWKLLDVVFKLPMMEQLAHKNSQIKVRGAFACLILFMVIAQFLNTEIILGAFLVGLIISLISDRKTSQIFHKFDAIAYGIFIPVFFIMVGVNFNVRDILNNPSSFYLLPVLVLAVYAVTLAPTVFLKINYSWSKSIAATTLLSSRLSLIIATGTIALKLGIINGSLFGAIILVAIITCTLSPLIFNHLTKK
ncbi:sodium:proton antiporter [Dehalobacter sp. MCB1]|uniref:cation:proton antiporter n=1 Tax=unclassified Dehalobacter TaxID=2635733 RepID=UPI000E6C3C15|nr:MULTISPECIES: cation:proton antiporter [unclassified Dehalobacter]RJE48504.1 sodium:proton antiporter [Dehalobacter sp. MCB1]TCX54832.1 cation:proton antiporter [Dehalobacter sp. 12DCB1]